MMNRVIYFFVLVGVVLHLEVVDVLLDFAFVGEEAVSVAACVVVLPCLLHDDLGGLGDVLLEEVAVGVAALGDFVDLVLDEFVVGVVLVTEELVLDGGVVVAVDAAVLVEVLVAVGGDVVDLETLLGA